MARECQLGRWTGRYDFIGLSKREWRLLDLSNFGGLVQADGEDSTEALA